MTARCRKLFDRIGAASPRYNRVMDTHDAGARQSLLATMDDCYFGNANVDTVGGYCVCTEAFLTWLSSICHLSDFPWSITMVQSSTLCQVLFGQRSFNWEIHYEEKRYSYPMGGCAQGFLWY